MKKRFLLIPFLAWAVLSFSTSASAAFYLNVINKSHAGSLFKISEEDVAMHSDGVATFPGENPTTVTFYIDERIKKPTVRFKLGTRDGKSYCQFKLNVDDTVSGYIYTPVIESTANLRCTTNAINHNTTDFIIQGF